MLELYNNNLKRIDSNTFEGIGNNLEKLSLNSNAIEEIDVRIFENLSNLKLLWLAHNKLKRIDANTFKGLTKLETLQLQYNRIEEIDSRSFESFSNLKDLKLNNNELKEIDWKCFEPLKSIEVIELYENVGLNAVSFINQSTEFRYNEYKVEEYGSVSEWSEFLKQFPQLGIYNNSSIYLFNYFYLLYRRNLY